MSVVDPVRVRTITRLCRVALSDYESGSPSMTVGGLASIKRLMKRK